MGSIDAPLAPLGRDQAIAAGERVRGLGIGAVWSSPLARAKEAAEILARALELPVQIDSDLREMSMGAWEGLTKEEIRERFPDELRIWEANPEALVMERYERLVDVQARAVGAVRRICQGGSESPVLIVTHLNVLRLLAAHFEGRPIATYASLAFPHCSISEVVLAENAATWRVLG